MTGLMGVPLIYFLLPKDTGSVITDITYQSTGEPEHFESVTLNEVGEWSTEQPNGRRNLSILYITEFTVQRGDEIITRIKDKNTGRWDRIVSNGENND